MNKTRMVQVSRSFVEEALYNRFAEVADAWGKVPDEVQDEVVSLIAESGSGPDDTPSSIVDNFIVNGKWGPLDEYMDDYDMPEEIIEAVANDDTDAAYNLLIDWRDSEDAPDWLVNILSIIKCKHDGVYLISYF